MQSRDFSSNHFPSIIAIDLLQGLATHSINVRQPNLAGEHAVMRSLDTAGSETTFGSCIATHLVLIRAHQDTYQGFGIKPTKYARSLTAAWQACVHPRLRLGTSLPKNLCTTISYICTNMQSGRRTFRSLAKDVTTQQLFVADSPRGKGRHRSICWAMCFFIVQAIPTESCNILREAEFQKP